MQKFKCIHKQMTVQLNENCNLNCAYCMATKGANKFMSLADLNFLKEFILTNEIGFLKITGGEPTLHPHFIEFINWLTKNNIEFLIFSNLATNIRFSDLLTVPNQYSCSVLVNISEKDRLTQLQRLIRDENIKVLKSKGIEVNVSCTIFSEEFKENLLNALACAINYNSKILRISVANPRCDGSNVFLTVSNYYAIVKEVLNIISNLQGVKLVWDCVLPPCLFPQGLYNELAQNIEIGKKCLPRLSINYDLSLTHCYVITKCEIQKTLRDFEDMNLLNDYIIEQYEIINKKYKTFAECKSCKMELECLACFGLRSIINGGYLGEFARRYPL